MAHRFNCNIGRPQPKPSARDRTWERWRFRKGMETKQDIEKRSAFEKLKEKLRERFEKRQRR